MATVYPRSWLAIYLNVLVSEDLYGSVALAAFDKISKRTSSGVLVPSGACRATGAWSSDLKSVGFTLTAGAAQTIRFFRQVAEFVSGLEHWLAAVLLFVNPARRIRS